MDILNSVVWRDRLGHDGPKGNGKKIYLGSFLVAVTRNIEECILFSQEYQLQTFLRFVFRFVNCFHLRHVTFREYCSELLPNHMK